MPEVTIPPGVLYGRFKLGCLIRNNMWLPDIIAYDTVAPTTAIDNIKSPSPVSESKKPKIPG